jgi:protein SDA1
MWQGWDVESDSSEESDSEDWINVDDDNCDLVISDSDDEGQPRNKDMVVNEKAPAETPRISTLATTKVFSILRDKYGTNCILP